MPFGQTFQRLSVLLEPEVTRVQERQSARIAGCDAVRYVAADRAVAYLRGGSALWIARAELLGRLPAGFGLLRWWWYGAGVRGAGKSRLDAILAEGQQTSVREFVTESVPVDDEAAAETLCRVAAFIARADGFLRLEDAQGIAYYALFDAPGARLAVSEPPPASVRAAAPVEAPSSPPPVRRSRPAVDSVVVRKDLSSHSGLRAAAPLGHMDTDEPFDSIEPSTSVRGASLGIAPPTSEPPRELLLPVAQMAMAEISASLGSPFQKAMMVVSVGVREGKARFSVSLTSVDNDGELAPHDASKELCAAVADLIGQHAKLPGGRWRRLVTRFRTTPRGASVDVSVSA